MDAPVGPKQVSRNTPVNQVRVWSRCNGQVMSPSSSFRLHANLLSEVAQRLCIFVQQKRGATSSASCNLLCDRRPWSPSKPYLPLSIPIGGYIDTLPYTVHSPSLHQGLDHSLPAPAPLPTEATIAGDVVSGILSQLPRPFLQASIWARRQSPSRYSLPAACRLPGVYSAAF